MKNGIPFVIGAIMILGGVAGYFIFSSKSFTPPESIIPLPVAELKYRILERFGGIFSENQGESRGIFYCDRDFYPVAFRDEQELAIEKFPELESDEEEFKAILKHANLLGVTNFSSEQKLLIYREHKHLNAIALEPTEEGYGFHLTLVDEKTAGSGEGALVDGIISRGGVIKILKEEEGFYTTCPICLAGNAMIDTPNGFIEAKNIRVGMPVWTKNAQGVRSEGVVQKISRTKAPQGHKMSHVILADGRELFASPGHPTADNRLIGNLNIGDNLDGARIIFAERVAYEGVYTYDFLPSGDTGTYWEDGIHIGSTLR